MKYWKQYLHSTDWNWVNTQKINDAIIPGPTLEAFIVVILKIPWEFCGAGGWDLETEGIETTTNGNIYMYVCVYIDI